MSLLRLHRTEEALSYLEQADRILAGKTPSDFHYSAVLAGFGDAYYQQGKFELAADAYEKALPEIELHMGRNNFYDIVSDNLTQTYARLSGSRPAFSGWNSAGSTMTLSAHPCWNEISGTFCPAGGGTRRRRRRSAWL